VIVTALKVVYGYRNTGFIGVVSKKAASGGKGRGRLWKGGKPAGGEKSA
jgi:hypothetical protein